jgi:hypothetical protein
MSRVRLLGNKVVVDNSIFECSFPCPRPHFFNAEMKMLKNDEQVKVVSQDKTEVVVGKIYLSDDSNENCIYECGDFKIKLLAKEFIQLVFSEKPTESKETKDKKEEETRISFFGRGGTKLRKWTLRKKICVFINKKLQKQTNCFFFFQERE